MRSRKNRKPSRNQNAVIIVIAFLALLVFFILRWNEWQRLKFIRYEAFGIEIPEGYDIHGIDISRYQQYIDWEEVKKMNVSNIQLKFAFIKATEGENYIDPYFKRNWKESQKNKLIRGAYHFFIPDKNAATQARIFIASVKLLPGDLPPVLDVEVSGTDKETLKKKLRIWLQIVEGYYRVKPIIYTNADFYKKYLGNDFDEYPLWVAHYYEPHKPRITRSWAFWQHNDRGNVNGIDHKVDFNVFNGDSTEFAEMLIK